MLIDRKFREKERLHGWKLVKETFLETFEITISLFVVGLVIVLGILIAISAIKWGKSISSFATLLAIIVFFGWWRWKKKKANQALASRLQRRRR